MGVVTIKTGEERHSLVVQLNAVQSDLFQAELAGQIPMDATLPAALKFLVEHDLLPDQARNQLSAPPGVIAIRSGLGGKLNWGVGEREERLNFIRAARLVKRALRFAGLTKSKAAQPGDLGCDRLALDLRLVDSQGSELRTISGKSGVPAPIDYSSIVSKSRLERSRLSVSAGRKARTYFKPEAERSAQIMQQGYDLSSRGFSTTEIAMTLRVKLGVVRDWFKKGSVIRPLWQILHGHPRQKSFATPRCDDADFAYALGAFLTVGSSGHNSTFHITACDRDALEELARCFGRSTSIKHALSESSAKSTVDSWLFSASSIELATYYRRETLDGQRVPWTHLGSEEALRAFLRGVLDFNSGVTHRTTQYKGREASYPCALLTFTGRAWLVSELMVAFSRIGVLQSVFKEGNISRLEICGQRDLAALRKLGFSAKRKAAALEYKLARAEWTQPDYSPDVYYTVMQLKQQGLTRVQIARHLEIPESLVKSWSSGRNRPRAVVRLEKIEAISQRLPSVEAVAFLAGELNLPGIFVYRLASACTLEQLRVRAAKLRSRGVDLSSDPARLLDDQETETVLRTKDEFSKVKDYASWREMFKHQTRRAADVEAKLIKDAQAGDLSARDQLIFTHQWLVAKIIKENERAFSGHELDAVQEAQIGLLSAISGFDLNVRGLNGQAPRFSTYAYWEILRALTSLRSFAPGVIKLPDELNREILKLKRTIARLAEDGQPTDEALARDLGWSVAHVKLVRSYAKLRGQVSVDAPLAPASDEPRAAFISSKEASVPDKGLRPLIERAFRAIDLDDREQQMLFLRFGVGEADGPKTLQQVGERLDLTRERIRQIEAAAMRKVAANAERREVKALLDYLNADIK